MFYDIGDGSQTMSAKPYGLICPITHACEVLEPRWTIPILTEMWGGASRFNDIRRGVGNISPALLSKRLKELESLGLIERIEDPGSGQIDYIRTGRAIELEPILNALGNWAQRNIAAQSVLEDLTISNLMWNMRNYIFPDQLPDRQIVIQFHFSDHNVEYDTYWALVRPGSPVEICVAIPGFEVDLFVETSSVSLSAIILSRSTITREIDRGRLFLSGDMHLARTMDRWFYQWTKQPREEIIQLDGVTAT